MKHSVTFYFIPLFSLEEVTEYPTISIKGSTGISPGRKEGHGNSRRIARQMGGDFTGDFHPSRIRFPQVPEGIGRSDLNLHHHQWGLWGRKRSIRGPRKGSSEIKGPRFSPKKGPQTGKLVRIVRWVPYLPSNLPSKLNSSCGLTVYYPYRCRRPTSVPF